MVSLQAATQTTESNAILYTLCFTAVIVLYCSHLYVVICRGSSAVSFFSRVLNTFSLKVSLCA